MGKLIQLGNYHKNPYEGREGIPYKVTGYYKNADAVEKVLHYVSRTRELENKHDELLFWSGHGVKISNIDTTIHQFQMLQKNMRETTVRKLFHLSYTFDNVEQEHLLRNIPLLKLVVNAQANIFFCAGYQVVYSVHYDSVKRLHAHFVINSVNPSTGLMLHYPRALNSRIENLMTSISYDMIAKECGKQHPFDYVIDGSVMEYRKKEYPCYG